MKEILRVLFDELPMIAKMKKSIKNACGKKSIRRTPVAARINNNVFFDIAIDDNVAGQIEFRLYDFLVPKTAANFRALCTGEKGFGYQGTKFFYIAPDFIIQGGDITNNDGTGGKSIYGEIFDDEDFIHHHSQAGILSMGNRGRPNTNGSQFLITAAPTPSLDGKHVVFGEVFGGMKIIEMIENHGQLSGKPKSEIIITKCGIVP